jgi:hypothetical protein
MDKHPLTIEKDHLKSIAADIINLKFRIRGPHIRCDEHGRISSTMTPEYQQHIGRLQQHLAQTKRVYRHRFAAYCLVRQSLGKLRGPIMAPGTKLNLRMVNIHRVRLLAEIARAQSKHIDRLGEDLAKYEPCIATFKSEASGAMKNLKIQDFQIKDNGDFVWNVKEDGHVFNKLMNWKVERNDAVWLEKESYDDMAPFLKLEKDQPAKPCHTKTEFDKKIGDFFGAPKEKMMGTPEKGKCENVFQSYWNFVTPPTEKAEKKLPFLYQKECYEMVYDVLNRVSKTLLGATLEQCWTSLPTVPNQLTKKYHEIDDHRFYDVCGHAFAGTVEIEYVRDWVKTRINDIETNTMKEILGNS